jgi:crotonobetainyl-CoA:carnitine CoA-transferase CaiB-like acyl-CoA transferase
MKSEIPTKPLAGIRVLELGAFVAGPYAAALLAMLGAEVVKVEPPSGGDAFRRGMEKDSHYFIQMNVGKKSIAVDLKTTEGVALLQRLIPQFDVLIENSRPGKMASLGLGVEEVRRINPSIVYASVSGFGDGGPWRDRAAYDTIGLSMSAFLSIMSDRDKSQLAGTCVGDLVTALVTTMGILASLVGRGLDADRKGTDVRTSLLEAMSTITIDAMTQHFETGETPSRETRHPQAQSFCPTTADGGALTIHLSSSEKFWRALLKAIERPELGEDPRFVDFHSRMAHYFELKPIVETEFLKASRYEWERRLIEADVPFAPVLTVNELAVHPQTKWLQMLERGEDGTMLVRPPWRFDGERGHRTGKVAAIGEHSREVALQFLPADEVEMLITKGVLKQAADTGAGS